MKLCRRHLVAALAALPFAIALSTASGQDIKIGYNSDQSGGGAAEHGLSGRFGVEAAVEDINKAGGVLGRKVVLVNRDDTGQPPKSIQNMNELIDSEKVVAVIGPTNSGNALAWLHLPQQKKVPVISHVATATEITKRYEKEARNYIFRVSMVDREQVALLAAYAVKASKTKKIALIGDSTGYGQGGVKDAVEILKLHGVTPVANEKFQPKDTDMTSQLSKIKNSGADVLIVYALADANAHLMKSMEKLNFFPVTLGSWANLATPFVNIAGKKLAENLIFAASVTETSNERAKALNARILAKEKNLPIFVCAAQGYDAMMLLAAAIKKAGSTDGEKIRDALEAIDGVQGVIKTYNKPFTKTHHEGLGVADFRLAKWKDGKVVDFEDAIAKGIKPADLKK
jgi:branched-chain amino acid transport system substrate-binding protein